MASPRVKYISFGTPNAHGEGLRVIIFLSCTDRPSRQGCSLSEGYSGVPLSKDCKGKIFGGSNFEQNWIWSGMTKSVLVTGSSFNLRIRADEARPHLTWPECVSS